MPADPLSPQESFSQAGLAWATEQMARTVTIRKQVYTGVRTELTEDPGDAQSGGFRPQIGFSIVIPKLSMPEGVLEEGFEVTDDLGARTKILRINSDAIQITLFCGSQNR